MLPHQGSKEQVEASPRIKAGADKAIRLDPRNDVAWHVLGRWHKALANVGGVKRALGGLIYGKLPTTTNEAASLHRAGPDLCADGKKCRGAAVHPEGHVNAQHGTR
jgi:hypothetical protein